MSAFHQPLAYRFVLRAVHHALRGDECRNTTLAKRFHTFEEKTVVNFLHCLPFDRVVAFGKRHVENGGVAKGNVACNHIKTVVRTVFDFFKTSYMYPVIGMLM
jgi:hypothetical protein